MNRLALAAMLLGLAGCGERRSFDERYRSTEEQLNAKIRDLDSNLASDAPVSNEAARDQPAQPSAPPE